MSSDEYYTPDMTKRNRNYTGVLRTVEVNGVMLDEGGAVIGVLLDVPDAASGLAPVMVTLR
ncbi:MAG: hypothetical protein WAV74_05255 [Anaerolineae bacterium]|uniref:hypothetical protein n=2 Tax=Candidatus Amarolinea dominans TaxID=3140696 RepID=UPI0031CCD825